MTDLSNFPNLKKLGDELQKLHDEILRCQQGAHLLREVSLTFAIINIQVDRVNFYFKEHRRTEAKHLQFEDHIVGDFLTLKLELPNLLKDVLDREFWYKKRIIQIADKRPEIPKQEPGIRFGVDIETGRIGIDRQSGQSDADAVRKLQPGLKCLLKTAQNILNKDNAYYGFLADILADYETEIMQDAENVEFGVTLALATELRNGLIEARVKDRNSDLPDLPPRAAAKVQSVLDMNSTLMAETELGNRLVAQTELYNETPDEMRAFRAANDELRESVDESEGVFTDEAKRVITGSLNAIDGKGEVKGRLFERIVTKNVGISVAGTAAIVTGAMSGVPILIGVSAIGGLYFSGGIVKAGKSSWNELSQDVQAGLKRIRNFAVDRRHVLQKTTNLVDKGEWFSRIMGYVLKWSFKDSANVDDFSNIKTGDNDREFYTGVRIIVIDDNPNNVSMVDKAILDYFSQLGVFTDALHYRQFEDVKAELRKNDLLIFNWADFNKANLTEKEVIFLHLMKNTELPHVIYSYEVVEEVDEKYPMVRPNYSIIIEEYPEEKYFLDNVFILKTNFDEIIYETLDSTWRGLIGRNFRLNSEFWIEAFALKSIKEAKNFEVLEEMNRIFSSDII